METKLKQFNDYLEAAQSVVVVQAENPDGDSLASSLALEHLLGDAGKEVTLYCASEMPRHLRHLKGWDRVVNDFPHKVDLSIIVDTSSESLLEKALKAGAQTVFSSKPVVVIDHHSTESTLSFDNLALLYSDSVATGEAIFEIAQELKWKVSKEAASLLASSIMYDSLGLVTEATTSRSIHIVAELVDMGVSLTELDEQRRALMRRSAELTKYKGLLLGRVEFSDDGLATIDIPWEEIEKYSDQYNPSMLVLEDMRMTEGVKIAIAFKSYPDGRITAKIRANHGFGIAKDLAESFGGGGHPYAAGFKVRGKDLAAVKAECHTKAQELIGKLKDNNETV